MLWLLAAIAVLLIIIVLLSSSIHMRLHFSRQEENDSLIVYLTAIFGLVRLKFQVPIVQFRGILDGLYVKSEVAGKNAQMLKQSMQNITLEKVITNFQKTKTLYSNFHHFPEWMKETLSRVTCTDFRWTTHLGVGDAANTAVTTGIAWGIKTSFLRYLIRFVGFAKRPDVSVVPQYNRTQFSTEVLCILKIRLGYAILAGLHFIVRIMKVKGGIKIWQNILFKA